MTTDGTIVVPVETLSSRIVQILVAASAPPKHAAIQADMLVEAELRGHPSHGLLRLPTLVSRIRNKVLDPAATGRYSWRLPALLDCDGGTGFGPVVLANALDRLIPCARELGCAVAAVRRTSHLGMLASYVQRAAEAGVVLIASTTSEALVHPWGGREAMVGTNPIAVGVPAGRDPLVLDMATSATSAGKIRDHAARRLPLREGWAVDAEGNPTTDANAAIHGALSPFGGAKGFGLGVALEVLVASMTGTALGREVTGTLSPEEPVTKGDLFIAMAPLADARGQVGRYLDEVRNSASAASAGRIRVPGDSSRERRDHSLRNGVAVSAELWASLDSLDPAGAEGRAS